MAQESGTTGERALLLLQAVLVPAWLPTTGAHRLVWVIRIAIVLGAMVLISSIYDKSLWEWLKLLIIPAAIAAGGLWFGQQQRRREVHWPQIDEDLSAAGLLHGVPARTSKTDLSAASQDVRDQSLQTALAFYADSLRTLKGTLQGARAALESVMEQLPGEEAKAQAQEFVDSYLAIEYEVDQAAQDLGVEHVVNQTAQQAQETVGQVAQQAQDTIGQVANQAGQVAQGVQEAAGQAVGQGQEAAGGAAQQVQETVGQAAQQAQGAARGGGQEEPNATDAARREARERGVDLTQIEGSGSGGRITVQDVIHAP